MTNAIQHNAANILALSMALFTSEVAASEEKFLPHISEPKKDDSRAQLSGSSHTQSLATT